jgi:hypothetical protein
MSTFFVEHLYQTRLTVGRKRDLEGGVWQGAALTKGEIVERRRRSKSRGPTHAVRDLGELRAEKLDALLPPVDAIDQCGEASDQEDDVRSAMASSSKAVAGGNSRSAGEVCYTVRQAKGGRLMIGLVVAIVLALLVYIFLPRRTK